MRKSTIIARGLPVVPNNVGPRSMPSFPALVHQGVRRIDGGIRTWAGQTDDPFFLGLGQIGDLVNIKPKGTAVDTLRGYNTQAIALQVPKADLTAKGRPTIGIFGDTQRRSMTNVLTGRGHGPWRTIERLGMPLTNEVLIGLDDKDRWNQANPAKDRQFDHYFLNPVLAAVLGAPATHRTDILTVFQTGVPKLNKTGGPHADFLRLNTGIAPARKPSQLGVLGGDTSGFPNGRRLSDDVVDIELKVVAGALLGKDTSGVSDNVQQNDEAFEGRFPYLAIANPGLLSTHVLHHMAR
jgi:hypothetical protein